MQRSMGGQSFRGGGGGGVGGMSAYNGFVHRSTAGRQGVPQGVFRMINNRPGAGGDRTAPPQRQKGPSREKTIFTVGKI